MDIWVSLRLGGNSKKHRIIYQELIKHSVSPGLLIGDSHTSPLRRCEFYILFGCEEFSFENLFSGICGLSTKTHPDICGSHLVTIHIYWYWAALREFRTRERTMPVDVITLM